MNTLSLVRSIEISFAENSPGDADLSIEKLSQAKALNHLNLVGDGVGAFTPSGNCEAPAFLNQQGKSASIKFPLPQLMQ